MPEWLTAYKAHRRALKVKTVGCVVPLQRSIREHCEKGRFVSWHLLLKGTQGGSGTHRCCLIEVPSCVRRRYKIAPGVKKSRARAIAPV